MDTATLTFTPTLRQLSNGEWVCKVLASNGDQYAERFAAFTKAAAERKVREVVQVLKLRAELQSLREEGNRLLLDPSPLAGNGSGKLEPHMRALDTAECFNDMPYHVWLFREYGRGTGSQRGRRSTAKRLACSPWLRTHAKRDASFVRKLARAFPHYPWPDNLR